MKLKILGCSGGIGAGSYTTSMLLETDVLIDAGTGVGKLDIAELMQIDHIFITHAHLDHVASIPFLVDTVGHRRNKPITVYAIQETLDVLQQHLFNWKVWPDFNVIPTKNAPYMQFCPISVGTMINLNGCKITPLPANHSIPAVGFQLNSGKKSLVFTGDTTSNNDFWVVVNQIENLGYLIIESAFSNQDIELAIKSKHLCPSLLADELQKLTKPDIEIYITHLRQEITDLTMHEIASCVSKFNPQQLINDQVIEF